MVEPEGAQRLLERQTVEVAPLAFMRGRTLNNSFIILDEAQNTSPEQMKMFLTRIGFGSKVVVTGDMTQVDVADGRSGLIGLERILTGIDGLAWVHLTHADVVRHQIVADIVAAYETQWPTTTVADASPPRSWPVAPASAVTAMSRSSWPTSRPRCRIDAARWSRLAEAVLAAEGVRGHAELSLLFVNEDEIAGAQPRVPRPVRVRPTCSPSRSTASWWRSTTAPKAVIVGPIARRRTRVTSRCCSATS